MDLRVGGKPQGYSPKTQETTPAPPNPRGAELQLFPWGKKKIGQRLRLDVEMFLYINVGIFQTF